MPQPVIKHDFTRDIRPALGVDRSYLLDLMVKSYELRGPNQLELTHFLPSRMRDALLASLWDLTVIPANLLQARRQGQIDVVKEMRLAATEMRSCLEAFLEHLLPLLPVQVIPNTGQWRIAGNDMVICWDEHLAINLIEPFRQHLFMERLVRRGQVRVERATATTLLTTPTLRFGFPMGYSYQQAHDRVYEDLPPFSTMTLNRAINASLTMPGYHLRARGGDGHA